jgi:hypothetical protein
MDEDYLHQRIEEEKYLRQQAEENLKYSERERGRLLAEIAAAQKDVWRSISERPQKYSPILLRREDGFNIGKPLTSFSTGYWDGVVYCSTFTDLDESGGGFKWTYLNDI